MASRSATRAFSAHSQSPAPVARLPTLAQPASTASPQLQELRRQWKWAAFSQFFFTFNRLVALDDVALVDIEEDLVNGSMIVLPRLMQRLLITLTQDRKTTVDNWQTTLRRQYLRREPDANPIGVEPIVSRQSRAATEEVDIKPDIEERPTDADDSGEAQASDADLEDKDQKEKMAHAQDKLSSFKEDNAEVDTKPTPDTGVVDHPETKEGMSSLKDWSDLSFLEKLDSIHTVMEWHFQNPLRFRQTMRSDDEEASWRIEPIGYDAKLNAYWYIGPDRLWIQRTPPKPPRKSHKRKAPKAEPADRKNKVAKVSARSASPTKSVPNKQETPRRSGRERGARSSRKGVARELTPPPILGRGTRAAKTQANAKLDLQAKELAATRKEMLSLSRRPAKPPSPKTSRMSSREAPAKSVGTRLSSRLRGKTESEDEWQPVPDEWLAGGSGMMTDDEEYVVGTPRRSSTRLSSARTREYSRFSRIESGNESDLTELTEAGEQDEDEDEGVEAEAQRELEPEPEPESEKEPEESLVAENFIEWETLCVSLYEWETVADQWAKATHYLEKNLYKKLKNEIVPYVTENLREIERQRQKEESLMNRKRSSRLAIRETEKESIRLEAIRKAEEEDKMARQRRMEARNKKEEEEREAKEHAREQRRKEREERELARTRRLEEMEVEKLNEESASRDTGMPAEAKRIPSARQPEPQQARPQTQNTKPRKSQTAAKPRASTAANEDWELDCDVCRSKGINKDDGQPLMSCGKCGKWQHINCHNAKDRVEGRPPRNWEVVDFTCLRCLKAKAPGPAPMTTEQLSRPKKPNGQFPQQRQSPHPGGAMIPAASRKQVQGPEPAANGFAGFTHYHPQQLGFSASPSAAAAQVQPQQRQAPYQPAASNDTHMGWPAASSYAQFFTHNQNGMHANPHIPIPYSATQQVHPAHMIPAPSRQPVSVPVPVPQTQQTGPHYPHQIFNSQPAYNNHTPYRPQA